MTLTKKLIALGAVALMATSVFAGQDDYAEPFDSLAADVTVLQQPDTTVDYVDYSNFTIGNTAFSIPESPRMIPGSLDTRGIVLRANKDDLNAAAAAVNVIAGNAPIVFTGEYTLSYDMYMSVPILENPLTGEPSLPGGSTEQGLWGVGASDGIPNGRNTRLASEDGTWGWLANENGYGTEDAAIWGRGGDGVYDELCDLGDTQINSNCWPIGGSGGFESEPFNMAFDAPITPGAPNNAPGNQWVEVDIVVSGGRVSVQYNGVEFFNEESSDTNGFAFLGYEDPFSSITADPNFPDAADGMFGLFDNFRVTIIPEPSSSLLVLCGMALAMFSRRRS